jgi:hypothetical protein
MRNRQANGLSKSGRYKAEDIVRLKYIHGTGLPLIQKGRLPLALTYMLELGPLDTLRGLDKVNLEKWVRKNYTDPRSKNKVHLNGEPTHGLLGVTQLTTDEPTSKSSFCLLWLKSFNNHLKNLVWSTRIGRIMPIYILSVQIYRSWRNYHSRSVVAKLSDRLLDHLCRRLTTGWLIKSLTSFARHTKWKSNRWLGDGVIDVGTLRCLVTSRTWWVRCCIRCLWCSTYASHMSVGEVALTLVLVNGHLHYPNVVDRTLIEVATDIIRAYHEDYNNRPCNSGYPLYACYC